MPHEKTVPASHLISSPSSLHNRSSAREQALFSTASTEQPSTNASRRPKNTLSSGPWMKQYTKSLFTRSSLFVGATVFALATLLYRYACYLDLKGRRDECRALAIVSLLHLSEVLPKLCAHSFEGVWQASDSRLCSSTHWAAKASTLP
jgi:hypothetical protein